MVVWGVRVVLEERVVLVLKNVLLNLSTWSIDIIDIWRKGEIWLFI